MSTLPRALVLTALVLVAALSPPAGAADLPDGQPAPCDQLNGVLRAARERFAAVRGAPVGGDTGAWQVTTSVPGGKDCRIFGGALWAYTCDLYAGDDSRAAAAAYDDAVALVRACLPAGWAVRERRDGTRTVTRAAGPGGGPALRVVSGIRSGDAYLVDLWVDVP